MLVVGLPAVPFVVTFVVTTLVDEGLPSKVLVVPATPDACMTNLLFLVSVPDSVYAHDDCSKTVTAPLTGKDAVEATTLLGVA